MFEKDCPSCGAKCARSHSVCKGCGHKFTSAKKKKRMVEPQPETDTMAAGLTSDGGLIVFHIDRGTYERYTAAEAQQIKRALMLLPDASVGADAAQA